MRCVTHPDVETALTCSKCGKPICPKCMIQTPVGARCRECANLRLPPMYEVSAQHYLKAVGVGFGLAIVMGIAWYLVSWVVPFLFMDFLLAAAIGYAIGEVTSLSVNRKRGPGLQAVAGVSMFLSFVVSHFPGILLGHFPLGLFNLLGLLALALGIFMAVSRLR